MSARIKCASCRQWFDASEELCGECIETDVDADAATISALRAEAERMRAVVEAARALVSWDWLWALPDGQIGDDARADAGHLEAALDALDAAKEGR